MPTGMLHPDWTVSPWRECKEHWDQVRANLKDPVWPPQPKNVFMELTDDEEADVEKFKRLRQNALVK